MGVFSKIFKADIEKAATSQLEALMPGLQQQITANLYNQNVFGWIGNNQVIVDFEDKVKFVDEGFKKNADVYTCIDIISKKISECAYCLYEVKEGVTKKDLKVYENMSLAEGPTAKMRTLQLKEQMFNQLESNPILDLLAKPNPQQTYEEWMTDLAGFFLCTGDGYIFGNGKDEMMTEKQIWSQLYSLPSQFIEIISGGMFEPIKGYQMRSVYMTEVPIPANQVVHFKSFNPDFTLTGAQLYGQSPIKAIYRNVLKENEGDAELLKQIRNGGAYGFISPDGAGASLTKDQMNVLKEKFVEAKRGETLMDRIFPSSGPLKWTQIGMPSTDLQLIESLNIDTRKIYAAFHVPIQFSGSEAASTDNNMGWASKQLIYNATAPLSRKIRDAINKFVCEPYAKAYGKKYYFDFDFSSYPEMQEDMAKLTTWLASSFWITPDEKRIAQGYDKISTPEMGNIYVPANLVPIEELSLDQAYNNATINGQ
jgi:HK97 family phage portal protein